MARLIRAVKAIHAETFNDLLLAMAIIGGELVYPKVVKMDVKTDFVVSLLVPVTGIAIMSVSKTRRQFSTGFLVLCAGFVMSALKGYRALGGK